MTPSEAANAATFEPLRWLNENLTDKAIDLAAALLILLLGWWLARWTAHLVDRALQRIQAEDILRGFVRNLVFVALMVVVAIAALQKFGVPTTSLLAMLGAAGLAIGLALKDSLSNIASGMMLILQRPFKAGDSVQVAGVEGVVEQVRIFTTRMRTYQNELIVLPNSEITTKPIVNLTYKPVRRADIAVGIGFNERIEQVRGVLLAVASANPAVLRKPASDVIVANIGESSVNLVLRAWIKTEVFAQTRSDLTEAVHRELTDAGISMPYPQRDVHVYQHVAMEEVADGGMDEAIAKAAAAASD